MEVAAATTATAAGGGNADATPKIATICAVEGPDSKGIVAAFAQLLYGHGCNIIDAEPHRRRTEALFQRMVL